MSYISLIRIFQWSMVLSTSSCWILYCRWFSYLLLEFVYFRMLLFYRQLIWSIAVWRCWCPFFSFFFLSSMIDISDDNPVWTLMCLCFKRWGKKITYTYIWIYIYTYKRLNNYVIDYFFTEWESGSIFQKPVDWLLFIGFPTETWAKYLQLPFN